MHKLKEYVLADQAFFSKSSGVLDTASALKCLENLIQKKKGIILKNSLVTNLEQLSDGFKFTCNQDNIHADIVINCAGLYAVELRKLLGLTNFTNKYIKGNYLKLTQKLPAKHLIYPIPPADGLGLGIHLTMDIHGDQKFGPNTEEVSFIDYQLNVSLIDELYPSIKELFFTVSKEKLQLAYAGIRPKIQDAKNELVLDFVFNTEKEHAIKNYFELLGIESPGLTAAPAIGLKIAHLI